MTVKRITLPQLRYRIQKLYPISTRYMKSQGIFSKAMLYLWHFSHQREYMLKLILDEVYPECEKKGQFWNLIQTIRSCDYPLAVNWLKYSNGLNKYLVHYQDEARRNNSLANQRKRKGKPSVKTE